MTIIYDIIFVSVKTFTLNGEAKKSKHRGCFIRYNMDKRPFCIRIYHFNGQLCYLSASKIKNKQGAPELQIIISFNRPENAQQLYRERWQIETAFKALKSSGFNIEDTHLTDIKRIK